MVPCNGLVSHLRWILLPCGSRSAAFRIKQLLKINELMISPPEALSSEQSEEEDKQNRFLFVNSVKRCGASESLTCRRGETRTHLFFILFSGFETCQRFSVHLKLSVLESLLSPRSDLSCRALQGMMLYLEMTSEMPFNISSML